MSGASFDARRAGTNLLRLGAAEFTGKLLSILAFTWLGRTLGPQGYGRLEFAFSLLVFFSLPVDFGLGVYGARGIAKDRSRAAALAADISVVRLCLAAVSFAVLLVVAALAGGDAETRVLVTALGASLFAAPVLLQWLFQGLERMQWVAWVSALRQAIFAAAAIVLVRSREELMWAGVVECLAALGAAIFCLVLARNDMGAGLRLFRFDARRLWRHVRSAAPIGFSEFAWALLWYAPLVVLGAATADRTVGWFGAAHRCLTSLHSFVYLYFFNLLPSMSRCAAAPVEFGRLLQQSLAFAAIGGVGAAALGILFASPLMTMLYGRDYAGGDRLFSVLVLVIPVTLVSGHFRFGLVACGRERQLLSATLIAAIASCALSFLLVPVWGAMGAAVALLGANIVNLVVPYSQFRRGMASPEAAPA